MLGRILIVLALGITIIFQAAVISVMKDSSKKMVDPDRYFHKWLIIWAAVNTSILVVGSWIITGSIFGLGS